MSDDHVFVRVAVAGPPLRSFTYHADRALLPLTPGQRLVVPFGRMRKIGYFLGETDNRTGIKTRPVTEALDDLSLLSNELFQLCTWMADYYLANPADCLSAALPSIFKSRRRVEYRWAESLPADVAAEIAPLFKPGRKLAPKTLASLRAVSKQSLSALIERGLLTEHFGPADVGPAQEVKGYRVGNKSDWSRFFARRRFKPEPFAGLQSPEGMKQSGWSAHYIREGVNAGVILPVHGERQDAVLDFVKPKADVVGLKPTSMQQEVIDGIAIQLNKGFATFLIHGITGSGKTLVYCHLASKVVALGKTVLVLTPEISLSGIALAYLRGFFGDTVTVWHSAMSEREKLSSWSGIRSGKYRIVVGPRSALFAPLVDLGLIIVDEEHDSSYKQDDPAPRFHGRDAAIVRAKLNHIPVVLGSASPSLESYYNAQSGRYHLLHLSKRPGKAELPKIEVVDHNRDRLEGEAFFLSYTLKKRIDRCLDRGEQAILFLNRRGFSPRLVCRECGDKPVCPSCQVHMTYHSAGHKLVCHYCGHMLLNYRACRKCGSTDLIFPGAGTQKIESSVAALFEKSRPVRFDSDTASGRRNAHRILQDFAEGNHNLLLGTQMVTKGLDLPGVTLVGVLSADHGLHWPDFRAAEKTFARLLQVAGRSGRAERPGEVVIQTVDPANPVIDFARRQDYASFFEREILTRRELFYPPFSRLVNVIFSGPDETRVQNAAHRFGTELAAVTAQKNLRVDLLGPVPCPLSYIRKAHRVHILLKTDRMVRLVRLLREWEGRAPGFGAPSTVKVVIDVDPDDMM